MHSFVLSSDTSTRKAVPPDSGHPEPPRYSSSSATRTRSCDLLVYGAQASRRRRSEELQGDVVGIAEGQARAVAGVDDPAVGDVHGVQPGLPPLELGAVGARERQVVEADPALVERLRSPVGELVQPDQHTTPPCPAGFAELRPKQRQLSAATNPLRCASVIEKVRGSAATRYGARTGLLLAKGNRSPPPGSIRLGVAVILGFYDHRARSGVALAADLVT
jgi:hypothetical protein